MAKRMVRYLAIEEALQEEIKDTPEHNNQSYGECCAQTDNEKTKRLNYCYIRYGLAEEIISEEI